MRKNKTKENTEENLEIEPMCWGDLKQNRKLKSQYEKDKNNWLHKRKTSSMGKDILLSQKTNGRMENIFATHMTGAH